MEVLMVAGVTDMNGEEGLGVVGSGTVLGGFFGGIKGV